MPVPGQCLSIGILPRGVRAHDDPCAHSKPNQFALIAPYVWQEALACRAKRGRHLGRLSPNSTGNSVKMDLQPTRRRAVSARQQATATSCACRCQCAHNIDQRYSSAFVMGIKLYQKAMFVKIVALVVSDVMRCHVRRCTGRILRE